MFGAQLWITPRWNTRMARSKPLEGGSSAEKKSPPQRRCGRKMIWGQALEGTETLSQSHTIHVACTFYLHGGMRWVYFYGNFHVGKYTYNPHMDGAWECMVPVAWKRVGPSDRNITSIPPTAGRQFTCQCEPPKTFPIIFSNGKAATQFQFVKIYLRLDPLLVSPWLSFCFLVRRR